MSAGINLAVDHHANTAPAITIAMRGRQYVIVRSKVVGGECFETTLGIPPFDSIHDARQWLKNNRLSLERKFL